MRQTISTMILALVSVTVSDRSTDQERLKLFAPLVGEWKGTGQPQRGSVRGAWTEAGAWTWKLTKESAALAFDAPKGKYLHAAVLKSSDEPGRFLLEATLADGTRRQFSGKVGARNILVLNPNEPPESGLARITLTPLHETRFLMLLESKGPEGRLARIGEVGYTKQGIPFAAGDSSPTCIVTDGRGTIAVTHKGKTYYVCCSGCKDLFEDDPEGVLAEAERRKTKAK